MHVGHKMLELRKQPSSGTTSEAGGGRPAEFDKWIDTYSGDAFEAAVASYRSLVEAAAASAEPAVVERMSRHFKKACELEWMFWDAALKLDGWPAIATTVAS